MYFVIALIPAFMYGFMGIVLMKLGGDRRQQTMGIAGGATLLGVVLALILGLDTSWRTLLVAFAAGICVGLGTFFQLRGFHKIGVSGVMPLTTAGQLVGISLLGVLLFGEWLGTAALPVGLAGLTMVTVGALLTSKSEKPGRNEADEYAVPYVPEPIEASGPAGVPAAPSPAPASSSVRVSGLIDTAVSTAFFIAFPIIIRWFDVDPLRSFLPQAVGLLAIGFVLSFPAFTRDLGAEDTRWNIQTLRAFIPGVMWAIGVVAMQFSQIKVGVAVGFSLSQLSVIIATFGGIFLLGESRTRKELVWISAGVALLVVGALLLGFAKTLDVA